MSAFRRRFGPWYTAVMSDVYRFCQAMNFKPTWQQKQVLDEVQKVTQENARGRIAVKSGQGPGKTTVSVIVALWRLFRLPDALVVVTAPTMRQCRDVWLAEARRLVQHADDVIQNFIKITGTRITVAGSRRWGVQLVTATNPEAMQGFHREEGLDFIADEASGIPRPLITQIKGTLSNPDSLFLMIGNPNTRDCAFFDCFNSDRQNWVTVTLNAEESPTWLVDPRRNEELAEEFGRDSDVYRIRVLGEFPWEDPRCVMSSEHLELCTKTDLYELLVADRFYNPELGPAKQYGLDFARFGGDENVVVQRQGNVVMPGKLWVFPHEDPADVVDFAFRQQVDQRWRSDRCHYVFDAGGMGQGVAHKFRGRQYLEFHTQSLPADHQFANRMTEAWFNFAKLVKRGLVHIPPDNRLIMQLSTRQYATRRKDNKLILEPKEDYVKRGHDSPDRADATVMAFYDHVEAVARMSRKDPATKRVGLRAG